MIEIYLFFLFWDKLLDILIDMEKFTFNSEQQNSQEKKPTMEEVLEENEITLERLSELGYSRDTKVTRCVDDQYIQTDLSGRHYILPKESNYGVRIGKHYPIESSEYGMRMAITTTAYYRSLGTSTRVRLGDLLDIPYSQIYLTNGDAVQSIFVKIPEGTKVYVKKVSEENS